MHARLHVRSESGAEVSLDAELPPLIAIWDPQAGRLLLAAGNAFRDAAALELTMAAGQAHDFWRHFRQEYITTGPVTAAQAAAIASEQNHATN